MKKKVLTASLLVLCAVVLVVGSVLTTIALLTASAGVSNVFTVGNISISMWESKVNSDGVLVDANGNTIVDENGNLLQGKTPVKVDTNSYHLVPGKTYTKDPTIYIQKGTTEAAVLDNMYLFVKSANLIRRAEASNYTDRTEGTTPLSMREQMEKYGWVEFVRSDDGTEIVWVYGTRDTQSGEITPLVVNKNTKQVRPGVHPDNVPAGEFRLCDSFTTHKNVDTTVYGAASVTFTGFAIQTTGFGSDNLTGNALTTAAWTALKESFPYKCGIDNPLNPYVNHNESGGTTAGAYDPVPGVEKAWFQLLTPPSAVKPDTPNQQG